MAKLHAAAKACKKPQIHPSCGSLRPFRCLYLLWYLLGTISIVSGQSEHLLTLFGLLTLRLNAFSRRGRRIPTGGLRNVRSPSPGRSHPHPPPGPSWSWLASPPAPPSTASTCYPPAKSLSRGRHGRSGRRADGGRLSIRKRKRRRYAPWACRWAATEGFGIALGSHQRRSSYRRGSPCHPPRKDSRREQRDSALHSVEASGTQLDCSQKA